MASVFCSLMCLNEYGTSVEDIEILRFMMIRWWKCCAQLSGLL